MSAILAIAIAELKRFVADKGNIFFVFILPLLLVFVIGSQFGGGPSSTVTVSGADGELRSELVAELEDSGLEVEFAEHDEMLAQVARGRSSAGIDLSEQATAAYAAGDPTDITLISGSDSSSAAVAEQIRVAVTSLDLRAHQLDALQAAGAGADDASAALDALPADGGPQLVVTDVDEIAQEFQGLGQFDLGASSQLLLFVFLTSLAGASTLISARREGVLARTLAAPVNALHVVLGQVLGRWAIAVFQGAYIMLASWLLFGVDWGNLALSLLILAAVALVAAGASMVLGSALDSDGAAVGAGVGIGLVLAAIGGGMVPLEIFSDSMRKIAHITPHAWGYDAFAEVQRHGGGLVDILPMLGVLAAMAVVLLVLGSWLLRRSLARAL
ncbi:ABC transporter permease [Cumulibacter soli]|uniref:ABC transporter permease n=1 Tax=Cumulibacter soli TaxID=2546344 RepID=UPI0010683ADC|nr:ABC transporter permease [Cumulibacter soli]